MRAGSGDLSEMTPPDVNVRNRVHEYGGGDYTVFRSRIFHSSFGDGRVWVSGAGAASRPLTEAGPQHADYEVSPDGRWLVCVEERPRSEREPENLLLAIPLQGGADAVRFAGGFDFVSFPRFSPDGTRLCFTSWQHPDMPWDATTLHEVEWGETGPGAVRTLCGGGEESIFQPGYSPRGELTFVSDRSGFWNLDQLRDGVRHALCPRRAEFGGPQWAFGLSSWAFVDADRILCSRGEDGRRKLALLDTSTGRLDDLDLPYEALDGVSVDGHKASFLGAARDRPAAILRVDLHTGHWEVLREAATLPLEPALVSVPESIRFGTGDGEEAHAFLYRPRNPAFAAAGGERPPLLVKSHGGPTGAASSAFDPRIQFWTSRGFAVVDVNYRGSTGFGRDYRNRLRGQWGVFDVDDCVAAASFAAGEGLADPERLAISGGSAGGFTTLCALTFRDTFRAGASHYGIGDLEALVRDTHKFESRYCDRLIGPYPERRDLYWERSPIHFTERLSCPVAFFQGLEDRVVPPNQAEAMVAALASQGIPHAYVAFEGEQHGFRRAENVAAAVEGELSFYGQVFGFEPDIEGPGVTLLP
jgi:dipeptidyl aminopeptidase/acylaminoacyl peptidase